MTRKKDVGRESGGGEGHAQSEATHCPTCGFPSSEEWPYEHEIELHERIRKLANPAWIRLPRKRIRELEARVKELKAERKKIRGYLTKTEKALTASQARAERAEARVAELENIVRTANDRYHAPMDKNYDYPPFALASWDDRIRWSKYIQKLIDEGKVREREELRGEDRG